MPDRFDALMVELDAIGVDPVVSGMSDELAAIRADLDTLDDLDPPAQSATFVKPAPRAETSHERIRRLVAQCFDASQAPRDSRRSGRGLSVRGSQPLSSSSPTSSTTATSTSSPTSSIAARAIAMRDARRAAAAPKRVKRQLQHEGHVVDLWNAMPADVPRWSITLRLSKKVQADMARHPEETDWLRRRANRELAKVLGAAPSGMWSIGVVSKGGPQKHLHAIIAAPADQIAVAGPVLRAVGGHQARPKRPDRMLVIKRAESAGEALYVYENAIETDPGCPVNGKRFVVSNDLRQNAKAARQATNKNTKRTSSNTVRTSSINIDLRPKDTSKIVEILLEKAAVLTHTEPSQAPKSENESHDRLSAGLRDDRRHTGRSRQERSRRNGARSPDRSVSSRRAFRHLARRAEAAGRRRRLHSGACQRRTLSFGELTIKPKRPGARPP